MLVLTYLFVSLFGGIIGSFLNVVIHRLPRMLFSTWREECLSHFNLDAKQIPPAKTLNLAHPSSHCPHCQQAVHVKHNIPIISYFWLGGHCARCQHPIGQRYLIVECVTACLAIYAFWAFGFTWLCLASFVFSTLLLVITVIDIEHQLIPDILSLSLLWLGLMINLNGAIVPLPQAVIGSVAGYLSLWCFMHAFKLCTGKVGMGHGDFKLLSALGAWLGWNVLPFIIVLASLLGSIVGMTMILRQRLTREQPIPFGPYLAISGWTAFHFGTQFLTNLLNTIGLA